MMNFSYSPRRLFLSTALAASMLAVSFPAFSQDSSALLQRLEYMEQEIQVLKQYRPTEPSHDAPVKTNVPNAGAAHFEVELASLEEEIRFMRGKIEEQEFEVRRLSESFSKLEADMDARMLALEERKIPSQNPPVVGEDAPAVAEPEMPVAEPVVKHPNKPTEAKVVKPAPSEFNNSAEHYDAAFKKLNQSDYDGAATLFQSFIKAYPKDELVGNAYYWLGETFYVQRQYENAAEQFRGGFQAMPNGAKAPDNLLKLGMSLSLLERRQEACVVLSQLLKKYPKQSEAVKSKATKESAKLQCK